uniref:Zinc finger protein C25B8.19c n=1 Tax=Anthurium amnicola TaxID=1678845 RepID=A0A1D1XNG1_9ARAE
MQNQTYLPPIRALLESPIDEIASPFNGNYSPSHSVPSPTYPTNPATMSPQSTDAHHLAAINAHNKLNSNGLPHTSNIRSLLSPPESPEMKSAGYHQFNGYGTQQPRYDVDRYISAPQHTQSNHQQSYEESCSCCIKPIPVYSAPTSSSAYSQYVQPQPQRYTYAPLSPYDRKPTAPSLPRLNTILESIASPTKHYAHKSFAGQLSPTGSSSGNRYQCPYCSKRFSRPSSLRIHTYSHTGEKPFVCTEPGCGRKFSVQSNMRRHLRVHRLGRPVKKTRYDGEESGYKMLSPGILRNY